MSKEEFVPEKYWDERLKTISGLQGVGYKKLGVPFNYWAYKVRAHVFLKQVKKILGANSKPEILDIGSGTGFYIWYWQNFLSKNITGVDISITAVENLKNKFPSHQFYQCDIGKRTFNEKNELKQYDCISAMDVLFHIVDDNAFEQSIENISSLLKPGGYFIYSDNFLEHRDTFRGESQTVRTNEYLKNVFEKNNLKPEIIKPFMYFTNSPIDSRNPLMKLYWLILENGLYILPFMGHIIGALLYPIEIFFVDNFKSTPTTKFIIYKKK